MCDMNDSRADPGPRVAPFTLRVADPVLQDLRTRLSAVRWPDEPPGAPWSSGASLAYMQGLVDYRRDRFDWRAQEARLNRLRQEETGYQWIQGTKPQTLAFGLTDSPFGLAAWIVEKFRAWSDCGGDPESIFAKDKLLANITLYWVTGAIGSSFWPYYARMHRPWSIPDGVRITVPVGYAEFPREIVRPPRSVAERVYNIQRWTRMARGGHFAAMEEPEALASEIRAFFRPLRHTRAAA